MVVDVRKGGVELATDISLDTEISCVAVEFVVCKVMADVVGSRVEYMVTVRVFWLEIKPVVLANDDSIAVLSARIVTRPTLLRISIIAEKGNGCSEVTAVLQHAR